MGRLRGHIPRGAPVPRSGVPSSHPHLAQRASSDLCRASLGRGFVSIRSGNRNHRDRSRSRPTLLTHLSNLDYILTIVRSLNRMRELKNLLYEQVSRIGKALASPKRLELIELMRQRE